MLSVPLLCEPNYLSRQMKIPVYKEFYLVGAIPLCSQKDISCVCLVREISHRHSSLLRFRYHCSTKILGCRRYQQPTQKFTAFSVGRSLSTVARPFWYGLCCTSAAIQTSQKRNPATDLGENGKKIGVCLVYEKRRDSPLVYNQSAKPLRFH